MIRSFGNQETERLFRSGAVPRFAMISKVARRKLQMLHAAVKLDDMRAPPGNHLEALQGSRKGQYSIRINDQWRICFRWTVEGAAHDVEIVDYH